MRIAQTPRFRKATKHLHPNQKRDLDEAVRTLLDNPSLGEQKKGDLSWLRVYKFRMVNQLTLLGYEWAGEESLVLHSLGSHENFYRDLKTS